VIARSSGLENFPRRFTGQLGTESTSWKSTGMYQERSTSGWLALVSVGVKAGTVPTLMVRSALTRIRLAVVEACRVGCRHGPPRRALKKLASGSPWRRILVLTFRPTELTKPRAEVFPTSPVKHLWSCDRLDELAAAASAVGVPSGSVTAAIGARVCLDPTSEIAGRFRRAFRRTRRARGETRLTIYRSTIGGSLLPGFDGRMCQDPPGARART
jgi:hypothetical protein